nr:MAG: wsv119-like protein [Penaeus semisulcatus pemonivirus]
MSTTTPVVSAVAETIATGVADIIVDLINFQLGERDKTTRQEVEDVFNLNSLDSIALNKLDNILREEQKAFPPKAGCGSANMWLQGLRYEWTKSREETVTREEELSNPLSIRCAELSTVWTLSLVFHLDTLAHMEGGFPELERLHDTVAPILDNLEVDVDMRTLPVHRPKIDGADLWCVANSRIETRKECSRPSAHAVQYAHNHLGAPIDLVSADKIRVEFVIQDAVNCASPWGSAPLLHVGSNFRVGPEAVVTEIKGTGSGTVKQTSCSYTSDSCFVYNRKDPTLEIPSKLNEVADSLRGLVSEVDRVFCQRQPIRFLPRKLTLSLALCHPKTRIRLAICTYVICYLPTTKYNRHYDKRSHVNGNHLLILGRGLAFDINNYKVSRKLSLVSREPCRMCSRICDHGEHPAHAHGRVPDFFGDRSVESVLPEYQHGPSIGEDIFTPTCESTTTVHQFFCEGVVPCYIDSVFNGNDRISALERVKSSLVVYGKALDTNSTENPYSHQSLGKKTRLRTFIYNQRRHCGSADNAVITQNTYYDLMEQKCDLDAARRHLIASRVLCDNGADDNDVDKMDRWRPLILKTIETHRAARIFADQVTYLCKNKNKEELTSLPIINKARTLCKRFSEVCRNYNQVRQKAFRGTAFGDSEGASGRDVQSENVTTVAPDTEKFAEIKSNRTVPWNAFWDEISKTLTTLADRRQATMLVMSNRAIAVASRMVIRGARCIASTLREGDCGKVKLHQFLMAVDGMVVAPTTNTALSHFSVCRNGVSATTAPNDDLPEIKLKTSTPLHVHQFSLHRPVPPESNLIAPVTDSKPYIIPQLRQGHQIRAYRRLPSGRWRQPQKTNDLFRGYGVKSTTGRC